MLSTSGIPSHIIAFLRRDREQRGVLTFNADQLKNDKELDTTRGSSDQRFGTRIVGVSPGQPIAYVGEEVKLTVAGNLTGGHELTIASTQELTAILQQNLNLGGNKLSDLLEQLYNESQS